MTKLQNTLKQIYKFSGKGLHTGGFTNLTLKPAPVNTGIRFIRTDLENTRYIDALAENVSSTERSTTISNGDASVMTIEHLLSALTGLDVDNAIVELDNVEVPILDGSSKPYIDAILPDGLQTQDAPRVYIELKEAIEMKNEKGAMVKIIPSDEFSYDIKIDFNSKVLGIQNAHFDKNISYAKEVGICRTFVFFHELEFLFKNNLIKGGDVNNAIVIVEYPVSKEQVSNLSKLFGKDDLDVSEAGYLSNVALRYENECSRHKLLDLIGDLRLSGGFLKARIVAEKAGHTINTAAAKEIRKQIKK